MIGDSEMAVDYKTRKFTADEYHAMAEAGILGPGERVELIEGEIVEMAPIGPRHSGRHVRLNKLLVIRFGDSALVQPHGSVRLSNLTEPEPDVILLYPKDDFYESGIAKPPDVIGLIELSDSSLSFDRGRKAQIYARARVPEYWIVNLVDDRLEIHREPNDLGYAQVTVPARDERVAFEALPEIDFAVEDFLTKTTP